MHSLWHELTPAPCHELTPAPCHELMPALAQSNQKTCDPCQSTDSGSGPGTAVLALIGLVALLVLGVLILALLLWRHINVTLPPKIAAKKA